MSLLRLAGALSLVCACVHPRSEPGMLGAGRVELGALEAEFTLLSWNMHKRGDPRFAAELQRFAVDVELLVLQEASEAEPAWSQLQATHAWTLAVAFELGRARAATGVATGSVVAPLREQVLLSPIREPLTATPKSALLSWIAVEGDTVLLLVNLHGVNFRPAPALDAQLRALDEALDAHPGPLVVAGDFNTWSANRREVVEAFAARHGLRSAFSADAKPRFDDVYVRGLVVHEAEVLPSKRSDHDALRVELGLPLSAG